MKFSKSISILSVSIGGLFLGSCGTPYHQPEEHYILVAANVNLPYWQEAEAGLRDVGKLMGVKVEMTGPASLSPNEELTAFKDAIAQHPSGVLVSVSNPQHFKGPI
jgi:ribose transport system substrate-binding protein